jgi:hypothetical protein
MARPELASRLTPFLVKRLQGWHVARQRKCINNRVSVSQGLALERFCDDSRKRKTNSSFVMAIAKGPGKPGPEPCADRHKTRAKAARARVGNQVAGFVTTVTRVGPGGCQ